jgi:hypothetical protein
MVGLAVSLIHRFTAADGQETSSLRDVGEVAAVALIAIAVAFLVPTAFNLRRQFLEQGAASKRAGVTPTKPARPRPGGSRS